MDAGFDFGSGWEAYHGGSGRVVGVGDCAAIVEW